MWFRKSVLLLSVLALLAVSCEWEGYVDPGPVEPRITVLNVPEKYETIQAAIEAAQDGDTIIVAAGTYRDFGNRDLRFGGKALLLRSADGPSSTIIDCQGSQSNPRRGFIIDDKVDSNTVVEGFTIINGYATDESYRKGWGGAVYTEFSSPKFVNCVFQECKAQYGGAVACRTAGTIFVDCVFYLNEATGDGGGIVAEGNADVKIRNCRFQYNNAESRGGAVNLTNASAYVQSSRFINNRATDPGYGGAFFLQSSSPTLDDCIFFRNLGSDGAVLYCVKDASPTVKNCTLLKNSSSDEGASAISCNSGSAPRINYCLIAENGSGPAILVTDINNIPSLACTNIFGNTGGDWTGPIAGRDTLAGNLFEDPLFCGSPVTEDARLDHESPCWPDNNSCKTQIGAFVESCDSL
jgi:hypothetical protein